MKIARAIREREREREISETYLLPACFIFKTNLISSAFVIYSSILLQNNLQYFLLLHCAFDFTLSWNQVELLSFSLYFSILSYFSFLSYSSVIPQTSGWPIFYSITDIRILFARSKDLYIEAYPLSQAPYCISPFIVGNCDTNALEKICLRWNLRYLRAYSMNYFLFGYIILNDIEYISMQFDKLNGSHNNSIVENKRSWLFDWLN